MKLDWLTRNREEPSSFGSNIDIVNAPPGPWLQDLYFLFLTLSWPASLSLLGLGWLLTNAAFAVAYTLSGGIEEVRPGSFVDAFHFSVQTFQTIGYGAMSPTGFWANLLVDLEAMTALVITALFTGLVFAKFGRASARVRFAKRVVISTINGVPTLMMRAGNARHNQIVDTSMKVVLFRTEQLDEGSTFYRMIDLPLVRDWSPALARSLLVMHTIDEHSPLYGMDAEAAAEQEIELMILLNGTDDTLMSEVHAMRRYSDEEICFGARFADVLRETDDGRLVLDVACFDEIEPARLR